MVPVVFAVRGGGTEQTLSTQRKAAAALGLISAIGAYGGFLIPQALNLSVPGHRRVRGARSYGSSPSTRSCSRSPTYVYVRLGSP